MLTGVTWGCAVSAPAYDEHAIGRQAGGGEAATAAECLQCGSTYAADPGWRRTTRLQSAVAEAAALTGAAGAARGGDKQPPSQRQSMVARALSPDTLAEAQHAKQNEEDCDRAECEGVLNPPLQRWADAKTDEWWSGRRSDLGPEPPFYSYSAQPRAPTSTGRGSQRLPSAATAAEIDARTGLPIHTMRNIHAMSSPNPPPPYRKRTEGATTVTAYAGAARPIRTAPPPTAATKDAPTERAELLRWAGELGVGGGLDGSDDPLGTAGETDLSRRLRRDVRARASETLDLGRLRTALGWVAEFKVDTRREPLFKPLQCEGDMPALRYNQSTLDSLAEYIRQRGSKRRGNRAGALVSSDAISSYTGVVRLLCGAEAGYAVTSKAVNVTAPAALKRMRQVDGPPGERTLQRGMRAHMMRTLAERGFDRTSARGQVRWAAALLSHNLLLRGGELGVVDGKPFDTERDLTVGSIEFKQPCAESGGHPWLVVDTVSVKDVSARHHICPLPVRRRQIGGTLGNDPMCAYDAMVLLLRQRLGRTPPACGRVEGAEALMPLFTRAPRRGSTNEWRTSDTNKLAQDMAASLGLDVSEFGGKSFRIAGATDLAAAFGVAKAELLIKQRGRWQSDVQHVYERALAEEHLGASAAIGEAAGRELEALCPGWAQPATFR